MAFVGLYSITHTSTHHTPVTCVPGFQKSGLPTLPPNACQCTNAPTPIDGSHSVHAMASGESEAGRMSDKAKNRVIRAMSDSLRVMQAEVAVGALVALPELLYISSTGRSLMARLQYRQDNCKG